MSNLPEATPVDLLRARITLQERHVKELKEVARKNPQFQDLYAAEKALFDQLRAALTRIQDCPRKSSTRGLIDTYRHFDEQISQGSPLTRTTSLNIEFHPPAAPHFLRQLFLKCGKCLRTKAKHQ